MSKKESDELICKVCGREKGWNDFHRNDAKKTICKECLKYRDMYDPLIFEAEGYVC